MHPMRSWSFELQLTVFVVLEHGLLMARRAIKGMISSEPSDVQGIVDFNQQRTTLFLQNKFAEKYAPVTVSDEERQDVRSIDISIGPSAVDMELVTEAGLNF